jgi:hypothetical protein
MKSFAVLALLPAAQAFSPAPARWASRSSVAVSSGRREALGNLGLGLLGAAVMVRAPDAAVAGYLNKDSLPEVLAPSADALDRDLLKSSDVQGALKDVAFYANVAAEMQKQLLENPQLDLKAAIVKYFPFDKIRAALNTANTALDEDTQRGTDRLVRNIIQDITELEAANYLKPGVARSERKVDIMNRKLQKLEAAFGDFCKFFEV